MVACTGTPLLCGAREDGEGVALLLAVGEEAVRSGVGDGLALLLGRALPLALPVGTTGT